MHSAKFAGARQFQCEPDCLVGHPQDAVLDRHSQCCASGAVDACGECDGPAKLLDVELRCCGSDALDAAGYCCASGLVDECGVCDGQSTSCALHVIIDVQVHHCYSISVQYY
jgi:hypothetical protein